MPWEQTFHFAMAFHVLQKICVARQGSPATAPTKKQQRRKSLTTVVIVNFNSLFTLGLNFKASEISFQLFLFAPLLKHVLSQVLLTCMLWTTLRFHSALIFFFKCTWPSAEACGFSSEEEKVRWVPTSNSAAISGNCRKIVTNLHAAPKVPGRPDQLFIYLVFLLLYKVIKVSDSFSTALPLTLLQL